METWLGGEGRDLGRDLHVKGPSESYCCSASPNRCVCTVPPGSPCLCRAFASALASPEKCRSCLLGCALSLSRTHWGCCLSLPARSPQTLRSALCKQTGGAGEAFPLSSQDRSRTFPILTLPSCEPWGH